MPSAFPSAPRCNSPRRNLQKVLLLLRQPSTPLFPSTTRIMVFSGCGWSGSMPESRRTTSPVARTRPDASPRPSSSSPLDQGGLGRRSAEAKEQEMVRPLDLTCLLTADPDQAFLKPSAQAAFDVIDICLEYNLVNLSKKITLK